MGLNYVSLVLDVFNGQGSVVPGGVAVLTPSVVLTDVTDGQVIAAQPLTVQLPGAIPNAVTLLATDNTAPAPSGWTWGISFTAQGAPPSFSFFLPAGPASFTVTGSSATLTWTAGGGITSIPVGTGVQLSGGSLPGGFSAGVTYYVVASSGFTVQLSATPGGTAITSSGSGSGNMTVTLRRLSSLTAVQPVTQMGGYLTAPAGTPANGNALIATGPGSWGWSPVVVSNPMTTAGDTVYGASLGTPARLAGNPTSAREFLLSQGTGSAAQPPSWGLLQSGDFPSSPAFTGTPTAPTASPGTSTTQLATTAFVARNQQPLPCFSVLTYGADPTGSADSTSAFAGAYAAAIAALSGSIPGAYVTVPAGTYKYTAGNCTASDPRIGLLGAGAKITQVNVYGSGDAFYHYTSSFSTSGGGSMGLPVGGLTIDGTNTTGASTGLHIQDICSLELHDLTIQNFTAGPNQTFTATTGPNIVTTGSSNGLRVTGNNHWSERMLFLGVRTSNCSIGFNFDGTTDPAGGFSCDYMRMLDAYSNIFPGQVGLLLQGFAQLDQPQLNYSYNMNAQASGAASYAVVIGPTDPSTETSRIINALFDIRGEMDGSGSTCYDLRVGSWANFTGMGVLVNVGSMTAGAVNSGSVYISGYISTPAFPLNHLLFGLPGGGSGALAYSFATYTAQFIGVPASKGLTLLDWLISSQATRVTLLSGAGNPNGSSYFSHQGGDLFLRSDGGVTPNQQLYVTAANGSNVWQPVVAAAIASGTATLVAGAVTIANTSVTANSIIRVFNVSKAGTAGALSVTLTAGTSFTINSTSGTDTSKVYYEIVSY